ncbi:protein NLP8-like [Fagus crenata]
MLAGYHEVSRLFVFSTERKPGSFLGLPGRVFISTVPEWTSNVSYYNKIDYLRSEHAAHHEVRGSIALAVFFFSTEMSCCVVLELVTTKEKLNFIEGEKQVNGKLLRVLMDYPFSSKEKGTEIWPSSKPQMENSVLFDGTKNLNLEDSLLSSFPSTPYGAPPDALNFLEQNRGAFPVNEVGGAFNLVGDSFNFGDKMMFTQMDTQYGFLMDSDKANHTATVQNNGSFSQNNFLDVENCMVPRLLIRSIDEKMLRALSLFKDSSGYREVSRLFVFPTERRPGSFLGLPGRVFISKVP